MKKIAIIGTINEIFKANQKFIKNTPELKYSKIPIKNSTPIKQHIDDRKYIIKSLKYFIIYYVVVH